MRHWLRCERGVYCKHDELLPQEVPMAIAIRTDAETLKITRVSDGLELDLEPIQGMWTEAQYLKLTDATNRLIEFTDGQIEVLPMPTYKHQMIFRFIFLALMTFVEPLGGRVLFAALRMQVRPGKFREPDILLLRDANDSRCQNRYWLGADLGTPPRRRGRAA